MADSERADIGRFSISDGLATASSGDGGVDGTRRPGGCLGDEATEEGL